LIDRTTSNRQGVDANRVSAASAAKGVRATVAAILASSLLAAIKIVAGVIGNSYALVADGIESILDIVNSFVVWGGLRIAASPPSRRYPYGYGKAEPLAGLVGAVMVVAAASGIAIQSVREIVTPHHAPATFTLIVLVLVVIAKEAMFRFLHGVGQSIGSSAVQTDAWHHRSDALTSAAAFVGISVALIAGEGYESADDWAALLACTIIVFNGTRLFRRALSEVMDVAPPVETERRIRKVASEVDRVVSIDKCRVRKSGLVLFVEIHVVVDGDISVRAGHSIAHRVKDVLLATDLSIQDVDVHVEPDGDR